MDKLKASQTLVSPSEKRCFSSGMLFFLWLSMAAVDLAGAQVGVCYGINGQTLPPPQEVVALYKEKGIQKMRLYEPYEAALEALRGTNIEVMLGIPDEQLQGIASSQLEANTWVQNYVVNYSDVKFRYVVVGNLVSLATTNSAQSLLIAMQNLYNAIARARLASDIRVSMTINTEVLEEFYPPSIGSFKPELRPYFDPIISFLANNSAPLLLNLHPYFSYTENTQVFSLDFALFRANSIVLKDGLLGYQNLFHTILDAVYSALEKVDAGTLEIVVSETGWPSAGGNAASVDNARTYNTNLIQHVNNGTPKRPLSPVETYIFALFDENLKYPELERHWGLYLPNKQPKYPISFPASFKSKRYLVLQCHG